MKWQDELDSFATNRIFLSGESVVEAFLAGKIFTLKEIEVWNNGHINETLLTPTLIKRIVELYARRTNNPILIEDIYSPATPDYSKMEPEIAYSDVGAILNIGEMMKDEVGEDSMLIIGLASDKDSVSPVGIWSWSDWNGLDFWGVPPADFDSVEQIHLGRRESPPVSIESPGGPKIGKTIFNGLEADHQKWPIFDEWEDIFDEYLDPITAESGGLVFAMKLTLERRTNETGVINWLEFPALLLMKP